MSDNHGGFLDVLATTVERITENHSSERLFNAADMMLYEAAGHIVVATTMYDDLLGVLYASASRKKLSSLKGDAWHNAVYAYYHSSIEDRPRALQNLRLARNLVSYPLEQAMECVDAYLESVAAGSAARDSLARHLHARTPHADLCLPLLSARAAYNRYIGMRDAIIEKYNRLIVKDIMRHRYVIPSGVNLQDMAMEYSIAAHKAFGLFDVSSGAFTSYLKTYWFKNARTRSVSTDEVGTSFSIRNEVRTALAKGRRDDVRNYAVNNPSVAGDDSLANSTEDLPTHETRSNETRLQQIIRHCDPSGLYRAANGMSIPVAEEFINRRVNNGATNTGNA